MPQRAPLFSVVVPTYKRPKQLRRLLESLSALDYPRDRFETIIVDDGSGDPPAALVREFSSRLLISLLERRHAGPAAARNAGVAKAQGTYVSFTDDDCAPASDWLMALERAVELFPDAGIGGQIVNALGTDPYSTASHDLVDFLGTYYNTPQTGARFFTTINLTLPRQMFLALGGFDGSFPLAAAEDRDLCDRWRERGWELQFVPDVIVEHAHVMNLRGFWRQHFNYGRGANYLHQARERRGLKRPRLEPLHFYVRLVTHPLRQRHGLRTAAILPLTVLSQLAYGAGYYWDRVQARARGARSETPRSPGDGPDDSPPRRPPDDSPPRRPPDHSPPRRTPDDSPPRRPPEERRPARSGLGGPKPETTSPERGTAGR